MMILIEVVIGTARSTPGAPQSQPHKNRATNTIGIEILRRTPTRAGSSTWATRFWMARRLIRIQSVVTQFPNWMIESSSGMITAMADPR